LPFFNKKSLYTTRYTRFFDKERKKLFKNIKFIDVNKNLLSNDDFPKISTKLEKDILYKMFQKEFTLLSYFSANFDNNCFYYKNAGNPYYRLAFLDLPYFEVNGVQQVPSTAKKICLSENISKYLVICLFPSSLFYWFWVVFSDCFHLTKKDLGRFPIKLDDFDKNALKNLCVEIQEDLKQKGTLVTYNKSRGLTKYLEMKPRYSKHLFDEVDKFLAEYYGFTDEELDFPINYDIKYRTD
jgi:hypothetical protein